jgi:hypothetical protein
MARKAKVAKPERGKDGVDPTLILWMLSLTPAERLQVLQDNARSIMRLRAKRKPTEA